MISLSQLEDIKLVTIPRFQEFIARFFLGPNYNFFSKVDIQIRGIENIPRDRTVIFAMNHTDRYNYWPFQYKLWSLRDYHFTTVWVKADYYRNRFLAGTLDLCNMIPVPNRKYLIQEYFTERFGRRMKNAEYNALKAGAESESEISSTTKEISALIRENFMNFIAERYNGLMEKVAHLSREALLLKNLNLIIFPEGTRSTRLGSGRTGLAQLALDTGAPIVPVGCSNCHRVYPGTLPFARSGKVEYRVGEPLTFEGALSNYRIDEGFDLFSDDSRERYRENFESVTDLVMQAIKGLIDEEHRDRDD